jgi:tellurite resistance protein
MPSKANRMNWSPPQELAVSNAYEIAALVAVLERKGLITQAEVLDEITRLKAKTPTAR